MIDREGTEKKCYREIKQKKNKEENERNVK